MTTSSTSLLPLTNPNESFPDRSKLLKPDSNPQFAKSSSKSRQLSRQGSRIITKDLAPSSQSDDNETLSMSGGTHSRQSSASSKKFRNKISHGLSVKSPRNSHNSQQHIHLERSSWSYISSDSDSNSEGHSSCKRTIEKSSRNRGNRGRSPVVHHSGIIDSKLFVDRREETNTGSTKGKLKATESRKASLETKVMRERVCDFIVGRSVESIRLNPQWTGLKRQIVFSLGPVSFSIALSQPLYWSFSQFLLLFLLLLLFCLSDLPSVNISSHVFFYPSPTSIDFYFLFFYYSTCVLLRSGAVYENYQYDFLSLFCPLCSYSYLKPTLFFRRLL